jgi:nitrate/TMAO reductase-like tetraheme cytochrome c subunit
MKLLVKHRRTSITACIIVSSVFFFTQCINKQKRESAVIANAKGQKFAGSEGCKNCHSSIYESHVHTAHFLTSRPATAKSIKGSFEKGKNAFAFTNNDVLVMEQRGDNFYQVEYLDGVEKKDRRFDIVVGSGTKGQSYLNWRGNSLFQLPLTYFTAAKAWSNSPGYPNKVVYGRPVTSRCLECHSTYFKKASQEEVEPEQFSKNQIIYGVDCERCHGPAADHVNYHSKHSGETIGKFVINPAKLNRQQNLDLCGLCHGGRLNKTKSSFQFKAGDKLNEFFNLDTAKKDAANIDVHGNQLGLLEASKCFRNSNMTCNTCHNNHENERGQLAVFSKRCMNCHNTEHNNFCKMSSTIGSVIKQNCIDCHMPEQSSKSIAVLLEHATTPTSAIMRTHFIKVYPDETKKFIATISKTDQKKLKVEK